MILLLDATLRVSVILLVALALVRVLRRRPASLRHAVLAIALACAAIVPVLSMVVPAWEWSSVIMPPAMRTLSAPESAPAANMAKPAWDVADALPLATDAEQDAQPPSTSPAATFTPPQSSESRIGFSRILDLAWMIYMAGLAISLATLALGLLQLRWIVARSTPLRSDYWQWQAAEIADACGLRRPVQLLRSPHPSLLAIRGIFRPTLLLPAGADEWPEERVRAVLLHEFAHVRRNDWIVQMLAGVLRAVHWFNPLVWMACARLRRESEHACDGEVITRGIGGTEYAAHLLELARTLGRPVKLAAPAPSMAQPSSLRRRVAAILDPAATHARANGISVARALAAMLVVTWIVAACHVARPVADETDAAPPEEAAPVSAPAAEPAARAAADQEQPTAVTPAPQPAFATPAPSLPAEVVRPTPRAVAAGIVDFVNAELANDTPVPLSQFDGLANTLGSVLRRAHAVIDDNGRDPARLPRECVGLINELGYAAGAATGAASGGNRPKLSSARLQQLAVALRAQAAALSDAMLPVAAQPFGDVPETILALGIAARDIASTTLADTGFVGPRRHTWLVEELTTLQRAARSVISDDGTNPETTMAKRYALLGSAQSTTKNAYAIADRADESEEVRGKATSLATSLRALAVRLDAAMTPLTRSIAAMSSLDPVSIVVPSIGCPSDGQTGPEPAPPSRFRPVAIDARSASQLAYYYAVDGPGVLAPRGWHCQAQSGSAGMSLFVTPVQLPASLVSNEITGPAVQVTLVHGDTSGRFDAARYIARLFPQQRQFVDAVIGEKLAPASSFPSGPYPDDQLTRRNASVVEYVTPAGKAGLGHDSWLAPGDDPVTGVVILLGEDHSIMKLTARLPSGLRDLAPAITRQVEAEAALLAGPPASPPAVHVLGKDGITNERGESIQVTVNSVDRGEPPDKPWLVWITASHMGPPPPKDAIDNIRLVARDGSEIRCHGQEGAESPPPSAAGYHSLGSSSGTFRICALENKAELATLATVEFTYMGDKYLHHLTP